MPSDFEDRYGRKNSSPGHEDSDVPMFPEEAEDTSESRPSLREMLKRKQARKEKEAAGPPMQFSDETRIIGSQNDHLQVPPSLRAAAQTDEHGRHHQPGRRQQKTDQTLQNPNDAGSKNVNFAALIGEVRKNLGTEHPNPSAGIQLDLKKARAEVNRVNQEIEEHEGRTRHLLVQEMVGELNNEDAPVSIGQGTTEALFGFKGEDSKLSQKKQRTEKSMIRRINELASSELQEKGRGDGRRGTSGILRLPDTAILEAISKGPSGPYRIRVDDLEYGPTDSSVILELVEEGLVTGADEISKSAWGGWQRLESHSLFIDYLERPFDRVLEEDSKIKITALAEDTEAKNSSTQGGFQFPDETRPANPSYSLAKSLQAARETNGGRDSTAVEVHANDASINPFTSREPTVVQGPTLTNPMRPPIQTPGAQQGDQKRSKKFNSDFKELSVSDIAFQLSNMPGSDGTPPKPPSKRPAPPPKRHGRRSGAHDAKIAPLNIAPPNARVPSSPEIAAPPGISPPNVPPPAVLPIGTSPLGTSPPSVAPPAPAGIAPPPHLEETDAPNGHPLTGRLPVVDPNDHHISEAEDAAEGELPSGDRPKTVTQIGHHKISPRATLGGRKMKAHKESDIRNTSKMPVDASASSPDDEARITSQNEANEAKPASDASFLGDPLLGDPMLGDSRGVNGPTEQENPAAPTPSLRDAISDIDFDEPISASPSAAAIIDSLANDADVADDVAQNDDSPQPAVAAATAGSGADQAVASQPPGKRAPTGSQQPVAKESTVQPRRETRLTPPPKIHHDDFEDHYEQPKRSSGVFIVAVAALVLLAAGGAYFLVFNKSNSGENVVAAATDGEGTADGNEAAAGDEPANSGGTVGDATGVDATAGGNSDGVANTAADANDGDDAPSDADDGSGDSNGNGNGAAGDEPSLAEEDDGGAPDNAAEVPAAVDVPSDGSLRSERIALMQKLRNNPTDSALIEQFEALIAKQASNPPAPTEITESWAPFVFVGNNPTILKTKDPSGTGWEFIPEHDQGPTWRGDYAFYELCGIIDCGFEVPKAKLAKISVPAFTTLAGEKIASGFPGSKGVIQGVLRKTVEGSVPFQIEDTSIWRNWLSRRTPIQSLSKKMVDADFLGGSIETRTALTATGPTVAQVAEGVANVLAADYLTNNFGRFTRHRSKYGQNLRFMPNSPFIFEAIHNQDAFQARESTRVRGRFNWSDRIGRNFLESVRRLKPENVSELLFPDITPAEKASMSVFWEQRSDLVDQADRRINLYGADKIVFE